MSLQTRRITIWVEFSLTRSHLSNWVTDDIPCYLFIAEWSVAWSEGPSLLVKQSPGFLEGGVGVGGQGPLKGRPVWFTRLTSRKKVLLLLRAVLAGRGFSFCTENVSYYITLDHLLTKKGTVVPKEGRGFVPSHVLYCFVVADTLISVYIYHFHHYTYI